MSRARHREILRASRRGAIYAERVASREDLDAVLAARAAEARDAGVRDSLIAFVVPRSGGAVDLQVVTREIARRAARELGSRAAGELSGIPGDAIRVLMDGEPPRDVEIG